MSVGLHTLINGGDTGGLFHGAIMQSGAPPPVGDISHGQVYYDALVKATNCTDSEDKLHCLRLVPYPEFKAAVDQSPSFFSIQVRYPFSLCHAISTALTNDGFPSRSIWPGFRVLTAILFLTNQ
jgi:hypothetical protein